MFMSNERLVTKKMDYELTDLNRNDYFTHLFERECGFGPRWAIGLGKFLSKLDEKGTSIKMSKGDA
jgi:hypothetical protein